jgi:hypothetical protein
MLDVKCDFFCRRYYLWNHLGKHRTFTEAALLSHQSGIGRMGVDFWPVLGKGAVREGEKRNPTITARHFKSTWDQLNMDRAVEAFLAPGPDGALSTPPFEMLREGIYESEARILIEKAVTDPAARVRLGEAMVKRCRELLDERQWLIRSAALQRWLGWIWYEGSGWEQRTEELFSCAAEVAKLTGQQK